MALGIDAETDRVVRELVAVTGETMTEAVRLAVLERLERERSRRGAGRGVAARLRAIVAGGAGLAVRDPRPPDIILGYGGDGLPR